MPTILRLYGYRIGFYSAEPDEPPHVHVVKAGHEAKFWLDPVHLARNKGFREADLKQILKLLETNRETLLRAWNESP
jgi:hypothetical protein